MKRSKSKKHLKRMARLRYAELMLKLRREGWTILEITKEINSRLKRSKVFLDDDGNHIQLGKSTIAAFLKEYEKRYKGSL